LEDPRKPFDLRIVPKSVKTILVDEAGKRAIIPLLDAGYNIKAAHVWHRLGKEGRELSDKADEIYKVKGGVYYRKKRDGKKKPLIKYIRENHLAELLYDLKYRRKIKKMPHIKSFSIATRKIDPPGFHSEIERTFLVSEEEFKKGPVNRRTELFFTSLTPLTKYTHRIGGVGDIPEGQDKYILWRKWDLPGGKRKTFDKVISKLEFEAAKSSGQAFGHYITISSRHPSGYALIKRIFPNGKVIITVEEDNFKTLAESRRWKPPAFFGKEVSDDPNYRGFKMAIDNQIDTKRR
jgi:hypothetical protein